MARRATVIGSGPNGLAAAVALARAGYSVRVLEASGTCGRRRAHRRADAAGIPPRRGLGRAPCRPQLRRCSARSDCSTGSTGSCRRSSYAQPLDGGRAGIAWRDLDRTAEGLGPDAAPGAPSMRPLARTWTPWSDFTGSQLLRVPRHPHHHRAVRAARRCSSAPSLGRRTSATEEANALFTGVVAHANTAPAVARRRGLGSLPRRARARR